jgi:hypothetical protein
MPWEQQEDIDASPAKKMLKAIIAGSSNLELLNEIFDNALDSSSRAGHESVNVKVEHLTPSEFMESTENGFPLDIGSEDVLKISDDGGGVKDQNKEVLVTLGRSIGGGRNSIGVFGVGLKAALIKLSKMAAVRTRAKDEGRSNLVVVPENWEDENGWGARNFVNEPASMPEGRTEIYLFGTTFDFQELKDELVNEAGGTYAKHLRGEGDYTKMSLEIDGVKAQPPEGIDWAYTPFYFYPRKYPEIEINPEGRLETPVYVDATVGYTRDNTTGTDIYCQGRRIIESNEDRQGGWGKKTRGFLGRINDERRRLRLVLEFTTNGDKTNLPWGENKSSIDVDSSVFRETISEIKSKVKQYYMVGSTLRKPLLTPYSSECDYSYNAGEIVEYDSYKSLERARNGEVAKKEHRETIRKLVKSGGYASCHRELGIYHYQTLRFSEDSESGQEPDTQLYEKRKKGYKRLVDKKSKYEEHTPVQEVPAALRETCEERTAKLEKKAKLDANKKRQDMSVQTEEWAKPFYEKHLRKFSDGDLSELDKVWNDFWKKEDSNPNHGEQSSEQDSPPEVESDERSSNGVNKPNDSTAGIKKMNRAKEGEIPSESESTVQAYEKQNKIIGHSPTVSINLDFQPELFDGIRGSLGLDEETSKDTVEKKLETALENIGKMNKNQNG